MSDGFPRAPSQREWDAMNPQEREEVLAALPGEVTDAELSPPEGDFHFQAKVGALQVLREYSAREHRRVYVASELPVYYPEEPRFAPDLLVVLEAQAHPRSKWVVSAEGKGLDFVLEVHVGGDRKKDAERNVERYGRLGIPEYFVYDAGRHRLWGWRQGARKRRRYVPLAPQGGGYFSEQLGLELRVEQERLRFYADGKLLLEYEELVGQLRKEAGQWRQEAGRWRERAEDEARKRQQAEGQRETEARKRQQAEGRLAKLEAELARLKSRR